MEKETKKLAEQQISAFFKWLALYISRLQNKATLNDKIQTFVNWEIESFLKYYFELTRTKKL